MKEKNEKIELGNNKYRLVKEYKNGFNKEELLDKYTDYFDHFDYIFGDYSYDKLRLKGFCRKDNANYSKVNDIKDLDHYIKNYCSYECRYFLLEKTK